MPAKNKVPRTRRTRHEVLQDHCRSLAGATEDYKWGDNLMFSVGGRMFAGFDTDEQPGIYFKCDDDDFDRLPDEVEGVTPAPYFASQAWVRVAPGAKITTPELKRLMTRAHAIIGARLSKKKQRELGLLD